MFLMSPFKVQLAKEYQKGMLGHKKDTSDFKEPPLGWVMSEKFDGYRALFGYDEKGIGHFYSRSCKEFYPPKWFLESMPPPDLLGDKIIDGELWAGRDNFQLMGVVRKKKPIDEEWIDIQYTTYDITSVDDTFINRLKELNKIIKFCQARWNIMKKRTLESPYKNLDCPIIFTEQIIVKSHEHMESYYQNIIENMGEGIMIKHPLQGYENGRSSYLLKYKPSFDREAIIIDYKFGKGKYENKLGSFICKPLINHDTFMVVDDDKDHLFTLSGMDDKIRNNYKQTHPIGTIITFEYSGLTDKGVPRFGRYLRKRTDVILKENSADNKLKRIIEIFTKIEEHCKNNYDHFRAKSYSKALTGLQKLKDDSELTEENFSNIEGIGKGLKDKIRIILETDTCPDYEKILSNKNSILIKESFLKIHGVGPNCAQKLVDKGFKSIQELKNCETIQDHLNDVQLKGLKYYDEILKRIPHKEIQKHEIYLKDILSKINEKSELTIAGSYRRNMKESGDIDVLIKAQNKNIYQEFINMLIEDKYIVETLANGPKKYMGISTIDNKYFRRIDIMFTKPEEYPFAILYFTGSGEFNVNMRNKLLEMGYTINEYSVKHNDTKKKVNHKFLTEKDIFDYFKFEYVDPHQRIK